MKRFRQGPCLDDPSALYRAAFYARDLRRLMAAAQEEQRRTFLRRKRRDSWRRWKRRMGLIINWLLSIIAAAEIGGLAVLLLRR